MGNLFLKFRNEKGIVLVVTFGLITVLLLFLAGFFSVSFNQSLSADIFKRRTRAFYLAESGLDHTIYWLRAQGTPPIGNSTNPWGGVQSLGGGTYSVAITDLGIVGGAGSNVRRYKVTSTGTYGNRTRILTEYVQVDNYARYLWFTNTEMFSGTNVWFWSQDSLSGPTHTNGHLNIYGTPFFGGDVNSVDTYIKYYNNGTNINLSQLSNAPNDVPTFQNGVNFGADPIVMPHQALNLRAAATSSGLSLTGNTAVVLNSNGTMNVTNSAKSWNNKNMALPANGALFVNKDSNNHGQLTISGTLKGRLSVGSSDGIDIPGNLVYSNDPRTNPSSTDVLGIISEGDVVIGHGSKNTPNADLEIDGCIMAMSTSFMMQDWDDPDYKHDTLTVLGGIIQDERGPVGTFNGSNGTKNSGYSKSYAYDARLLSAPPPFIPTTGDYIILSWEED